LSEETAMADNKDHAHGDHGHADPLFAYVAVFLGLMVLTLVTVWVASYSLKEHWDWGNIVVALTVAVIKATLVIMIFMHGWGSGPLVKVVIVGSVLTLGLLLGLTYADYFGRTISSVGIDAKERRIDHK
jgi:cytochrome c oxidase subunit 4